MQCKDLLGIDDATHTRIAAQLKSKASRADAREAQLCFDLETPMVAILNHGDPNARSAYQVRPIDISARELRFLHGRAEAANAPVVALLRDTGGALQMVPGRLAGARLVTGRIHLLTMRFDNGVDPAHFVHLSGLSEDERREVSVWQQHWKSLIKIEEKDLFDLMEELQSREDRQEFRVKRRSPRLSYRQGAILVVLNPEDPTHWGAFRVPTMDLSNSGLGFLHGVFVHSGTPCDILLTDVDGRTEIVHARVARCQVARGTVHQVGVRFDEPLAVERFMSRPEASRPDAA
jgi:hypothetical protein